MDRISSSCSSNDICKEYLGMCLVLENNTDVMLLRFLEGDYALKSEAHSETFRLL